MPEEGTVIAIVSLPGSDRNCVIFSCAAIPQSRDFRYGKSVCHPETLLMTGEEIQRCGIRVADAVRVARSADGVPVGLAVDAPRRGASAVAHAPNNSEGIMETHIPNRISTACEALDFISSYGRICEANDVKRPEMGGLAAVCDLVRGHLEVVESVVENIAVRAKERTN